MLRASVSSRTSLRIHAFNYKEKLRLQTKIASRSSCTVLSIIGSCRQIIEKMTNNKCRVELFHQPTLMHDFLYSLTICLLHYCPRHVSNINMPIFRRKNCIHTASGIFALCKRLHSTLVESGLLCSPLSTSPQYKSSLKYRAERQMNRHYDRSSCFSSSFVNSPTNVCLYR